VPGEFLEQLTRMQAALKTPEVLGPLAKLVAMEEAVYRAGRRNNYFADRFGIDVLTDTTERSPTYCTPPFRKWDDTTAAESWAYLYVPCAETPRAWEHILKRAPRCVEWSEAEVSALVGEAKLSQTMEVIRKIGAAELMRFKIGQDGLALRPPQPGGSAVAILGEDEWQSALSVGSFCREQLEATRRNGGKTGLICLTRPAAWEAVRAGVREWDADCITVLVPVPDSGLLLEGVTRVGLKLLLNALSTCTMVRLGRVMGNYMIWVVASNLKLIDRATRYIQRLTGLDYPAANQLLFEAVEYVEPRWKADKAYPPVVGLSVMRQRHGLTVEQAEERLKAELG
jgi:N-acetylmuramic acid 6-phosphate etherase